MQMVAGFGIAAASFATGNIIGVGFRAMLGLCRIKESSGNILFFCDVPADVSYPKSLQTPALSRRYYCPVRSLVSGLLTQLAKS
ncbi:hypothetical protein [Pantoea agglomerans]|uniref:hypothetical protein n=1 Tax=Enterobacter agglomerans TaxID=549 RepID=UPI003D2FA1F6